MPKSFTIQDFFRRFPDDDACLEHLFRVRFGPEPSCPKCGEVGKLRRLRKIPAYTCNCGHHVHPMQGTPFERSRTPLQKWFYAMYLFTTTRHGVPAKELQRQLGVTYKTAWRIGHELRKYMATVDGDGMLGGGGDRSPVVEMDKAFIGGVDKRGQDDKTVVLGIVERGGEIVTRVLPGQHAGYVIPMALLNIEPNAIVSTDQARAFWRLTELGYRHMTVNHSDGEYVRGEAHTNTIEGFWARLKASIRGTHVHVSAKHMAKYLGEFEFRFNLRKNPQLMFDLLLLAFPRP